MKIILVNNMHAVKARLCGVYQMIQIMIQTTTDQWFRHNFKLLLLLLVLLIL